MKKQTEINLIEISKEHKNELTKIVRETMAMGIVTGKKFTTDDLRKM